MNTSFSKSKTNLKPYEMLQTNNNESLYYGMIEINEELFKRIENPQSNSTRLLTVKGTDKPKIVFLIFYAQTKKK